MSEQTIKIEKMIGNGRGIGRLSDGMVVMMPYVLQGELVQFRIVKRHKDYLEAIPVEIISSSQHRVEPLCPYFERCGGCDFQHAGYDHQLSIKQDVILEKLSREIKSGDNDLNIIWQGIITSPLQFKYRQRIRLHVNPHGEVGFFKQGSRDLEKITHCLLAREEIDELLTQLKNSRFAIFLLEKSKEFELISSIGDSKVLLIFHLRKKSRAADITAVRDLLVEFPEVKSITLDGDGFQLQTICSEGTNSETCPNIVLPFDLQMGNEVTPYEMVLEVGGFSQVNHEQNQTMINTLIDWVPQIGVKNVLEMFCGMGNFSIPLALNGFQVSGFDLQRSAIRSAVQNAVRYDLKCNFFRASSDNGLERLIEKGEKIDLLIIDPPRRGCRESIPDILKSGCRSIIYISCDPATLCRDINLLIDAGFSLIKAKGFDMFPQTHHLETMVMLSR